MSSGKQVMQRRPYHSEMSSWWRVVRAGIAATALAWLWWAAACSDSPVDVCSSDCPPADTLVVSDPVSAPALASHTATASALASTVENEVTYVSLTPGTVLSGRTATIRRVGDPGSIVTAVSSGGFDPVPISASAGDSIDILVTTATGGTALHTGVRVAARRPPIVGRTNPARKKRDVPLNASFMVVFSEPISEGTLTSSSVRLLRGTSSVAGTVRLLQGTGTVAAFIPTAPLAANTEYRLEITRAVQDLDGDALSTAVSVSVTTGQSSLGPPASIELTPSDTVVMALSTYQLTATVRDGAGNVLIDQPIVWTSSNPAVTVSASGLLSASAIGGSYVTATLNDLSASVNVKVVAGPPTSIEIVPPTASVPALDTVYAEAIVRDAAGFRVVCPPVTWQSSNIAIATVGASYCDIGFVIGQNPGSATFTASIGALRDTASVTVDPPVPVAFVTVAPASLAMVPQGSKQLSVDVRDASGRQIGRPIVWASDNRAVAAVDPNGRVTATSVGTAIVTATSGGVSDTSSISVRPPLILTSVNAGWENACGVAPTGAAYCWGANHLGQLGNGTTSLDAPPSDPVLVSGGLVFTSVTTWGAVDGGHACGVTNGGDAYCWGSNRYGELGIGTTTGPETCQAACSTVPVLVSGGLKFTALTAGTASTCGLTTSGLAYCWGLNLGGSFGDGSTIDSPIPVPAGGGRTFTTLSARYGATCGVTPPGVGYCWGGNPEGQLGNGTTTRSLVPVAVSGGLAFSAISAGYGRACGVTTAGAAYCWGANWTTTPAPVSGGYTFSAVTAGVGDPCGVTTSGAAYCWGAIGSVPVLISGGLTFTSVSAGYLYACGVTTSGTVYCGLKGGPEGPLPSPP